MQLANPNALWWLTLALPIVALYLLQRTPRQVAISTRMFWDELLPETEPRRWWQRLREPLSLILTLLLLCLISIAMARPRIASDSFEPRWLVVVLDNSMSMQAVADPSESSETRFQLAKQRAKLLVSRLRDQDQMTLITTAPQPRQVVARTSSRQQLKQGIDETGVTDSAALNQDAIKMARRLGFQGDDRGIKIHLLTDGQGLASGFQDEPDTIVHAVGKPSNNLAITEFQARRTWDDPLGFELFVEVKSFSDAPYQGQLEVTLSEVSSDTETLLDVIPLELEPNGRWRRTIRGTNSKGGSIVGRLANEQSNPEASQIEDPIVNALRRDDLAFTRLPEEKIDVFLLTRGDRYLETALRSIAWVNLRVDTFDDSNSLAELPSSSVLIVDGASTLAIMPSCPTLFVRPMAVAELWTMGEPLGPLPIVERDAAPALLNHVNLVGELAEGSRACSLLRPDWETILEVENGTPILARGITPTGQRGLLLNLDPSSGDLVWRTAFPLLVSNAIQWAAGQAELSPTLATGETVLLSDRLPLDATGIGTNLVAVSPSGRRLQVSDRLGPLDEIGVWKIEASTNSGTRVVKEIACNIRSGQEHELRTTSSSPNDVATPKSGGRPLSHYLLVTALGLVIAEWYWIQRRWLS